MSLCKISTAAGQWCLWLPIMWKYRLVSLISLVPKPLPVLQCTWEWLGDHVTWYGEVYLTSTVDIILYSCTSHTRYVGCRVDSFCISFLKNALETVTMWKSVCLQGALRLETGPVISIVTNCCIFHLLYVCFYQWFSQLYVRSLDTCSYRSLSCFCWSWTPSPWPALC